MAVATGQSQGFSGTIESAIYTSQLEAIVTQLTAINQNLTDFNLSYSGQNSTFNAIRLWRPERSIPSAKINPPMNRYINGLE